MDVNQLKLTITNAIGILQDNKNVITPELLDRIQKVISDLDSTSLTNNPFQNIFNDIGKIVDVEKRLVETTMTDDLINILNNLQNRPVILWLVSKFL